MHEENKANFVSIYRWKPAIILKEKKRGTLGYMVVGGVWNL